MPETFVIFFELENNRHEMPFLEQGKFELIG